MNQPNIRTQTPAHYTEMPPRSFLLYGEIKVGKSATAAQFPKPLILNVLTENGTTELVGDAIDIVTPADLQSMVRWFKAGQHDYKTLVLDGLSTFVIDAVNKIESRDTRRAVKDATGELRGPLHEFLSLPCIRVLVAHARRDEEEIKVEENGRLVARTKVSVYPDLPPRLRQFVEGRVDAIGYCYPNGGKSYVWWLPLDTENPKPRSIVAGNRLSLPKTTELSYDAIHNAIVKPSAPQQAPAGK